ncbi:hypothetical protein P389DRAFT_213026 [Cystobasidium minutum MCA 4210]|uniref:uncharacterized protein n=1 Tax=Cystobasidium minutum MCA 4210 TaxID=1397322 RepID=UPI0034CF4364|eukprot:jgi/Rhomi1/213026/estExt_Genemark1.C_80262
MDTPVIDLTAAPDSPVRRGADGGQQLGPSSSSSSSSSSSEGASASTRRTEAQQQDTRNSNAAAGSITSNATVNTRRRLPYPRANAADTPIDLTDDDIEYLGEHRLHLPDQHHVEGNEARPVAGDNYSLMDRLRNAAGIMPFSRHASTSNNNRVIEEDPIRYGLTNGAGPGPAAVAAANARARRNNNATTATFHNINGNANPPAGLNARRNRQRAQNAYNANNNHANTNNNDPAAYYYRPVQERTLNRAAAARRGGGGNDNDNAARLAARLGPPRGGRRQRDVYQGLWPGDELDEAPAEDQALYNYMNAGDNDFAEDVEFQPHVLGGYLGFGGGNRRNGVGGAGALQGIMQLLGFGHHLMNNNAQPVNIHHHFNHANPPRRKVKAYSVRQSHPNFNKKKDGKDGFERDIVPPPEIEEEEGEQKEEERQPEEAKSQTKAEVKDTSTTPFQPNGPAPISQSEEIPRPSRINKGKGRALEIDTAATNFNNAGDDDIPTLDLANGSPNASTSTSASSTLFSGKLSNSTRATSAEQESSHQPPNKDDTATKADGDAAISLPATKPKTRIIRAPVCTSCSTILYLNQSSKGRPYVLLCGHIICRACLDAATARLKRWTMDEPEVIQDDDDDDDDQEEVVNNGRYESIVRKYRDEKGDGDDKESSLPPLPTNGAPAWKGARLKERFEEVDRSRSSTIADTSSTSKAKDKKGKKRATANDSIPASNTQTAAGPSSSTVASTSAATRSSKRHAHRPDYAELDGDEEGQPDGSYVPRSTRDGMDHDVDEDEQATRENHHDEDEDDSTLRSLIRRRGKGEDKASGRTTKARAIAESSTDEESTLAEDTAMTETTENAANADSSKAKGKGRIKIVMKAKSDGALEQASNSNTTTTNGKRKRGHKAEGDEDGNAGGDKTASTNTKAAKKQKIEKPPLIDVHWLTCPVNGCKGGTDLSQPIGSREGAWELFV